LHCYGGSEESPLLRQRTVLRGCESAYIETADYLHDAISKISKPDIDLNNTAESSFRDAQTHTNIQLPRISLPKFSGNSLEWETFRNTFESLVVDNDVLSNTQKFHYLKSSFSGDAALLIANLSDANYESAWKTLTDKYDDKQALIHAHIHSFLSLPSMKSENIADLKKLRETLAASIAALTSLTRPVDKWDDIIIYLVSQKFSPRTRNEWNLKRSASSPTLPTYKDFYEFLTLRIRGLTDLSESCHNSTNSRGNKSKSSINNVIVLKCIHYAGNHNLNKCDEFLSKTVAQRSAIVKQNKLCFNCMRSGHFTPKCKLKGRCTHCGRAHHSLLHAASETQQDPSCQALMPSVGTQPSDVAATNTAVADVQTSQTRIEPALPVGFVKQQK